ncbi:MAG: hypothetical protein WC872_01445 [Candidatus Absconditabacterales bacterium]
MIFILFLLALGFTIFRGISPKSADKIIDKVRNVFSFKILTQSGINNILTIDATGSIFSGKNNLSGNIGNLSTGNKANTGNSKSGGDSAWKNLIEDINFQEIENEIKSSISNLSNQTGNTGIVTKKPTTVKSTTTGKITATKKINNTTTNGLSNQDKQDTKDLINSIFQ